MSFIFSAVQRTNIYQLETHSWTNGNSEINCAYLLCNCDLTWLHVGANSDYLLYLLYSSMCIVAS